MSVNVPYRVEHLAMAESLVDEMRRNNGLAPVDLEQFWADQEIAARDPFGAHIPQVPTKAILTGECVFDELGIPEDQYRYLYDAAWRLELNQAYNDKAEVLVGRRILSEESIDATLRYPEIKGLHDVFEAHNEWHDQSWWLTQSVHNEDELEALLDRVEGYDIRSFILPDNWADEKARLIPLGIKPPLYRGQRGPITFATSIFGTENLITLILTNPDLAARFSCAIRNTMLEIARVLDEEAGYTPETAPHGFGFADDNCCLMTPDMYRLFGYPVLEALFARYAPDSTDIRHQHSDSPMAHLLPLLGELGLNRVNFGPTVMADTIREHLPNAVIEGVLAPFTYSRNEHVNIVLEFLRDFDLARSQRGLMFATAGSINNGTRLTSMRLVMSTIQRYGRYDA